MSHDEDIAVFEDSHNQLTVGDLRWTVLETLRND